MKQPSIYQLISPNAWFCLSQFFSLLKVTHIPYREMISDPLHSFAFFVIDPNSEKNLKFCLFFDTKLIFFQYENV